MPTTQPTAASASADHGLLQQAPNADAIVTFQRDKAAQVIAETINGTRTETTWDCCGRRTGRTIGDETVTCRYDPAEWLSAVEVGRVSSMGFRLQQRFNAVGLLVDRRIASAIKPPTGAEGKTLRLEPGRSYRWNASVESVPAPVQTGPATFVAGTRGGPVPGPASRGCRPAHAHSCQDGFTR
ncbi:hypothetical protein [Tabrizicola sp.]|uniref:hypothetical protein n=1 Tax=Tabrizicola sp. TaxID=2005166 RepID=UPI003F2D8B0C